MKFEVPQRRQLASERTPLSLFAPAPSTISFVPLTRNLSLADPSPCPVRGLTGPSEATATRFKASTDCSTCPPVATVKLGNAYQFEKFGTGNRLLRYGTCVPCSKRLPPVRGAFSEAFGVKNRLFRYGRDIRYRKRPPTVREAFSETFGDKKGLLGYATHLQRRAEQPTPQTVDSLLPHRTHLQCAKRPRSLCSLRRPLPLLLRRHSVPETAPARRCANIKRG